MAWFYVKSGGTATGDGGRVTTQRTGTWSGTASEYYDNLDDAIAATTAPTDGDFILCSHLHNATYLFSAAPDGGSVTALMSFISVDNANQENYLPGATEVHDTGSGLFEIDGGSYLFAGLNITANDQSVILGYFASTTLRSIRAIDCNFTSGAFVGISSNGASGGVFIELINYTGNVYGNEGVRIVWRGGTHSIDEIHGGTAANGGVTKIYEGVDCSASTAILSLAFSAANDDVTLIKLINCQLKSTVTLPAATDLKLPQHRFEMWGCDDSAGGELFRYHMQDGTGKVVNNNSKFVTAETAWYGGSSKSSYEVSTTALCSHALPFIFDLPIEYVDLADTATDLIRVALTTSLTLTDTEIAAYLVYPDGTTGVQANWVTSGKTVGTGNYGIDPLAAGSTLPTSTTAWTGALANKYQLDCDTSGDPGAAGPISVRIEIYRASITNTQLFIATEYEKA